MSKEFNRVNRREFLKTLASAAAATALAPSIQALEQIYEVNCPKLPVGVNGLIAIDEFFATGLAGYSSPTTIEIFRRSGEPLVHLGLNCFGGVTRWVAAPEQKLFGLPEDILYKVESYISTPSIDSHEWKRYENIVDNTLRLSTLFMDQNLNRHCVLLKGARGSFKDAIEVNICPLDLDYQKS